MDTIKDFSLKDYNTFGIAAFAKEFVEISTVKELQQVLKSYQGQNLFVLGGGSNMLLTKNIEALVVYVNNKGRKIIKENEDIVWVEGAAGENWHEFVCWTIDNGFGGLENMSLIPGNVGATPIQNIGAYGVEVKDSMVYCDAVKMDNQEIVRFSNEDCQFDYRESVFKNALKGQYVIVSVVFQLSKRNHKIKTSYGDITKQLELNNCAQPTIKQLSEAVIGIRKSKLPDPKVLGNSGSFFKNPIVSKQEFEKIRLRFPEIKFYEVSETEVKIPAGWLIEQAGFKGCRFGDAGVHKNQALVLVNYGTASGSEILDLSKKIQDEVLNRFGVFIATEVNII